MNQNVIISMALIILAVGISLGVYVYFDQKQKQNEEIQMIITEARQGLVELDRKL